MVIFLYFQSRDLMPWQQHNSHSEVAGPDMVMETFFIENDPAQEKLLSTEDTVAIILSLSIAFIIGVFIAFFLLRGNRRIKKAKAMRETARSQARRGHDGAQQENLAVEEEIG